MRRPIMRDLSEKRNVLGRIPTYDTPPAGLNVALFFVHALALVTAFLMPAVCGPAPLLRLVTALA